MAIYELDFYGLSKYGSANPVQFDASPFTAAATAYGVVTLTWSPPAGSYTAFRLIKSSAGYPVHESDGQTLYDAPAPSSGFLDAHVAPGRWVYYAIFLQLGDGTWTRAGATSCLALGDYQSLDWLWQRIPNYYRYLGSNLSSLTSSPENEDLRRFLAIFAHGRDEMQTYGGYLQSINDPRTTHLANLKLLAAQLGVTYQSAVSPALMRRMVANASTLFRQKGSLQGIRNVIKAQTGWDTDIQLSANIMLDNDQANFQHPQYPDWSPNRGYASGEVVHYGRYWFTAKAGGSAAGQAPDLTGITNTWWTVTKDSEGSFIPNPQTGGINTWEAINNTTGAAVGTGLRLGFGVQSPIDTQVDNNSLFVRNNSGSAADFAVRSVARLTGQSTMDPMQPIKDGIPIPQPRPWDASVEYFPGDLVQDSGRVWQALKAAKGGLAPRANTDAARGDWKALGYDGRITMTLSGYTHSDFVVSHPAVPVTPFMEFYDETGTLITRVYARTGSSAPLGMDTFTMPSKSVYDTVYNPDLNGRGMESYESFTWATRTGALMRDGYAGGVARPTDPATRSIATTPSAANTQVALTLRTAGLGAMRSYLVFRYSDLSNYWRLSGTVLQKVVAGAATTMGTLGTPGVPGDRISISANGSSITVFRNGVSQFTVTDAFNATAVNHGIGYE